MDAAPIPAKNDSGTDITSAHGQDTTKKLRARYIHFDQSDVTRPGTIASSDAVATTIGV